MSREAHSGDDPYDWLFSLERFGVKLGLTNITALSEALARPADAFRSVIIAGTNGKGSVAAMVERALRASGWRTGRYTSPHLVALEERFAVNGQPASRDDVRAALFAVREAAERLSSDGRLAACPTFFEASTACAFELFRRKRVEVGVLEVGLGGRFDAVNIVSPVAAAITSIDLDHQRFLGATIHDIAFEKAGVIKSKAPVIVGETKQEAVAVFREACRAAGAPLTLGDDDVVWRLEGAPLSADGRAWFDVETPVGRYGPMTLALRGRHQVRNALVAVRLLEALDAAGVTVAADAVPVGLGQASWPGRLQQISVGGGRSALLDAAHNPAGAAALAAYLLEAHPQGLPIVFGVMQDKDYLRMLQALAPHGRRFVITRPEMPRAVELEAAAAAARAAAPETPIDIAASPADALRLAWKHGDVICVTGSIFLLGAVLTSLGREEV